jgi:hypothetical protein
MGTGTNVQKRLVALHHLDAPWKPAEVEQRDGRILRQGNENKEVAIYRYVTEGSFDAYMWQDLETKARLIGQVITGDNTTRRAEDIGGQELSYAEVKAIASGNPAVLTFAEADAELQRLNLLKKNHLDEQFLARRNVRDLPAMIRSLDERLTKLRQDQQTAAVHADDRIMIGGRPYASDDAIAVLGHCLDGLTRYPKETTRFPLGTYRGLGFGLVLHPDLPPELYLEGATVRRDGLSREHQGPRAVLNGLERLADGCASECDRVRRDLDLKRSQLRDYQGNLDKPFLHERYLSALTDLRDQLKAGLSVTGHESGTGRNLDGSELAARMKTLMAANSVESTPERVQTRQASAEEPITLRIRRRHEAGSASNQKVDSFDERETGPTGWTPSPGRASPRTPPNFRERVATERRQNDVIEPNFEYLSKSLLALFLQKLQHLVQPSVIERGYPAERIGALKNALSDRVRDFLGQQQQLVGVGVKDASELHDQLVAGKFAERELLVLDLRQVGERDLDLPRQVPERQVLRVPKLANPRTENHRIIPLAVHEPLAVHTRTS